MSQLSIKTSANGPDDVLTVDKDGNITLGSKDGSNITESIIMKDLETGLRYKLVIRNGELCIEGADTQSTREVRINKILK